MPEPKSRRPCSISGDADGALIHATSDASVPIADHRS